VEYDAAKYSNAIATAPTTPDTTMPNPLDAPPLPTGLAWTETLEQSQGGEWVHTITLGWTEPVGYPFIDHYNIWVFGRGGVQFFYAEVSRGQTSWTSPQIAIGVTYAASVRSVSTSGKLSAMVGSPSAITPVGRVGTPPANVASLSADVSVPGTVTLTWPAASGTDIRSYELRYGGANWAAATVLDVVAYPAVRYETDKVPAGSTVFRIKSLDAVRTATYPKGQEATSEVTTTQTVLGKSGTYTPTLTNVSNATSISSRQSLWTRDGNIVTCSVAFDSGCTTAGTEITLRVTLPVASNIDIYDLIGAGAFRVSGTVFGPVRVYGDATNDEAVCAWVSSATLIAKCTVVFSYPVI
jgi:hypothetical protein